APGDSSAGSGTLVGMVEPSQLATMVGLYSIPEPRYACLRASRGGATELHAAWPLPRPLAGDRPGGEPPPLPGARGAMPTRRAGGHHGRVGVDAAPARGGQQSTPHLGGGL